MLDRVLRGGTVVDGTGAAGRVADVGIRAGRVAVVGRIDEAGAEEIDVTGTIVCPGFIDIHTHYDAQLLWDPTASPSAVHGVTTVVGGNCGFSIAPIGADDVAYIQRMMAVVEGIPLGALEGAGTWGWRSFAQYLDRIDQGLSVNAGFLVGHSTIRRVVMGAAAHQQADADQVAAMAELVSQSVAGGALGFSSSLGEGHLDGDHHPVPSTCAAHEEFVTLAAALRHHEGTTLEFIPTVGPIPEDRMELMADMSLAADRPLNWNLLGSLASEEIFARSAPGVRRSRPTRRPCGGSGPPRHDAHAGQQPSCWPAGLGRCPDSGQGRT